MRVFLGLPTVVGDSAGTVDGGSGVGWRKATSSDPMSKNG